MVNSLKHALELPRSSAMNNQDKCDPDWVGWHVLYGVLIPLHIVVGFSCSKTKHRTSLSVSAGQGSREQYTFHLGSFFRSGFWREVTSTYLKNAKANSSSKKPLTSPNNPQSSDQHSSTEKLVKLLLNSSWGLSQLIASIWNSRCSLDHLNSNLHIFTSLCVRAGQTILFQIYFHFYINTGIYSLGFLKKTPHCKVMTGCTDELKGHF